jgi:hypothetical protein
MYFEKVILIGLTGALVLAAALMVQTLQRWTTHVPFSDAVVILRDPLIRFFHTNQIRETEHN